LDPADKRLLFVKYDLLEEMTRAAYGKLSSDEKKRIKNDCATLDWRAWPPPMREHQNYAQRMRHGKECLDCSLYVLNEQRSNLRLDSELEAILVEIRNEAPMDR